jgi:threonylcarbamoyladenosine tRNA methylthiotransferase MtaB
MARKTTPEDYSQLLQNAREMIPEIAITTDMIVGFPGETEREFEESLAFAEKMRFSQGHVFTYSERPGTAAARMSPSVPYPVRKSRNALVREVLSKSERSYQNRFVGKKLPVLWESTIARNHGLWAVQGLTGNYLRISATSPEDNWNQISTVQITGFNGNGLVGEIVED